MGIDLNKFEEAKNKARRMIHEDAKQDAHIIKERVADRNNPKYFSDQPRDTFSTQKAAISESFVDDSEQKLYAAMDNKMNALIESRKQPNYNQQIPTSNNVPKVKNNNLPKEILESFGNNYIDQSAFNPYQSVLTTVGMDGGDILAEEKQNCKQNIRKNM